MRINEVNESMNRKMHDLFCIKTLNLFIKDEQINGKINFIENIYNDLIANTKLYQLSPNNNLYNYIDNDEFFLKQTLIEIKEDLLKYYKNKVYIILDNISSNEIVDMYKYFAKNNFHNCDTAISKMIEENINLINSFLKEVLALIKDKATTSDKKFIPKTLDEEITIDKNNNKDYLKTIYNDIKTTLKYMQRDYLKKEAFLTIKKIYVLIEIGDSLCSKQLLEVW